MEEENPEYVFKGRRSLIRSPPTEKRTSSWSGDKELERETNGEGTRKRIRTNSPGQEESEQDKDKSLKDFLKLLTPIERLKYHKEEIKKASTRELNHKISFTRGDQAKIRESLDSIIEESTNIIMTLEQNKAKIETLEKLMETQKQYERERRREKEERRKEREEMRTIIEEQTKLISNLTEEFKQMRQEQRSTGEDTKEIKRIILDGLREVNKRTNEDRIRRRNRNRKWRK